MAQAAPISQASTQPPTSTPVINRTITIEGIRITLSSEIASDGWANVSSGRPPSADYPEWSFLPSHLSIKLLNYPINSSYHQPILFIYPIAGLKRANSLAAQVVEQTKALLLGGAPNAIEEFPMLPIFDAIQLAHFNFRLIDFKNGNGLRYISQYGKEPAPINNYAMFYTFQGITEDGSYYLAAIFPIHAQVLPMDATTNEIPPGGIEFPGLEGSTSEDIYAAYIESVTSQLTNLAGDDFRPNLEHLDEMIASIRVAGIPGIDPNCLTLLAGVDKAYINYFPPASNRLRSGPSQADSVLKALQPGTVMDLISGPYCTDGLVFWEVDVLPNLIRGFTAESDGSTQWLVPCPTTMECPPPGSDK